MLKKNRQSLLGLVQKQILIVLTLFFLIFTLASCASSGMSTSGRGDYAPAEGGQDFDNGMVDKDGEGGSQDGIDLDRKIITNTNIRMESLDVQEAMRELATLARDLGGYIQSEYQTESQDSYYGELVVRVPAEEVDTFVARIDELGRIRENKVSISDVTAEYTDTASRLSNAKVQEARLLDMFEAAETIDELLYIQTELDRLQERIEVYEGQIKLWDNLVSLATISVFIYPEASIIEPGSDVPRYIPADTVWDRFTSGVQTSFVQFVNGASLGFIWLGHNLIQLIVFLIVLAILILVIRRISKKRKARPTQMQYTPMPYNQGPIQTPVAPQTVDRQADTQSDANTSTTNETDD